MDNMAVGIGKKEERDSYEIKSNLVENINKLSSTDFKYLEDQMNMLVHKSVHEKETIDDQNVEKDFITFLIRLYY